MFRQQFFFQHLINLSWIPKQSDLEMPVMKQIPTPQLVRITDPALVPIASLAPKEIDSHAPETIDTPKHSHETLWEEFLRLQLKPRTRQEYGKSIDYFCRSMAPDRSPSTFLQEFFASTKQQATHLVLEWRQHLLDEGKASATINLRISALKSLVEYAGKQDACSFSLSEIKSLKSQRYKDTPGVSVEDYRSILDLVDRSTDLGIRDYAILLLLWDLALRREEVVSIDIWDYSLGRLMVNAQGRSIDLNAQLEDALDHWMAIREGLYFQPKDGGNRDDALFLSCNGRRLAGTDIFRILQGYADAAGVKVSPDQVRSWLSWVVAMFDSFACAQGDRPWFIGSRCPHCRSVGSVVTMPSGIDP
jgi:integrase/recombinase XerC